MKQYEQDAELQDFDKIHVITDMDIKKLLQKHNTTSTTSDNSTDNVEIMHKLWPTAVMVCLYIHNRLWKLPFRVELH